MSRFVLALVFLAALSSPCVQGQPPSGEWLPGVARIIVADNTVDNSQIVALDLPSFNVTHRISIPGPVASIGLTADNQFAGVFRGRAGNDQQLLTFVHTGIKPLSGFAAPPSAAASTVPGYLRKLVITKSALVYNGTDSIGGVEGGDTLVYHPRWRTHLMYSEAHGLILAYNASASANPATALRASTKATIPPGHFHLIPVNNYLGAPHTTNSLALLLDTAGKIAYSAECGQCHGSIAYESSPTKAVILYGCNTSVLTVAINTSSSKATFTPKFIPVDSFRIGSFVAGAPGVYWTAAQPAVNVTAPQQTTGPVFFWRTDVRSANHAITRVNHPGSTLGMAGHVLKVLGLPEKQRMLAVHRAGLLVMYNGVTGAALGNTTIQAGGFSLDDLAPFLVAHGNQIYISVPSTGKVHEVVANFTTGALSVKHSVDVGGVLGTLVVADQAAL